VVVDEKGNILDGDQIIALCAIDMKSKGELRHDTVVVTVMSNKGLDLALSQRGIQVVRTAVGDRYVVEEMRKRNVVCGGEQSGHLLFLDSSTTGDGIIAALKVLEIIVRTQKPLSELAGVMHKLPQVTRNVKVPAKPQLEGLAVFQKRLKAVVDELGEAGRVLVRYSGTEALARITIEGPELHTIRAYAQELEEVLLADITSRGKLSK
jgi:phosphoglucosamine mutase